jgi:protein associated with RNAse G/E
MKKCLKINKKIYQEILAICVFEKETTYNVLNNILSEGIRSYKDRNLIKNFKPKK